MSSWVDLITCDELEPGDVTGVVIGDRRLAIYDAQDGLYVTQSSCTHAGADLYDGYLDGTVIECPLHQGCFDIRDGRPLDAPVTRALQTYPVRVVDGLVQVYI